MNTFSKFFMVTFLFVLLLPLAGHATCQGCPMNCDADKEYQSVLLESIRRDLAEINRTYSVTNHVKLATHILQSAKKMPLPEKWNVIWNDFMTNVEKMKFSMLQSDYTNANMYYKDAQMLFATVYKAILGQKPTI